MTSDPFAVNIDIDIDADQSVLASAQAKAAAFDAGEEYEPITDAELDAAVAAAKAWTQYPLTHYSWIGNLIEAIDPILKVIEGIKERRMPPDSFTKVAWMQKYTINSPADYKKLMGEGRAEFVWFLENADPRDFDYRGASAREAVERFRNPEECRLRDAQEAPKEEYYEPEPGAERVAVWKAARRDPAEAAMGMKPDFIDIRRPEGRRILPRSPTGAIAEWVGETKSYKTGTAIAEGLEYVKLGGRVLYIAAEDTAGIDTVRLPAACRTQGIDINKLMPQWWTWDRSIDLLRSDDVADLIGAVGAFRPSLIFVDVVTLTIGDRDPSSAQVGIGLVLSLMRIAAAFGATVVALTHPPEGKKRAFGSTLQGDLVYSTLLLSYDARTRMQRIVVEKMKNGEQDGFAVFMRNQPDADGVPVMVDVPPEQWDALARKSKLPAGDDEPDEDAEFRDEVLAAAKALHDAGATEPQPVAAVVAQMLGASAEVKARDSLNRRIRRHIKNGCLTELALRTADDQLAEPYAFRPWPVVAAIRDGLI